jgi:hypothetical protein
MEDGEKYLRRVQMIGQEHWKRANQIVSKGQIA